MLDIEFENDAAAYNNRGLAKDDLGDKQGAIADYNEVIHIKPDSALSYFGRGIAKSALGDNQGGLGDLRKASDLFQKQGNTKGSEFIQNMTKQLGG